MNWLQGALALAVWGIVAIGPLWHAARTVVIDVGDRAPKFFTPTCSASRPARRSSSR
jgi:hypothetical protein